MAILFSSKYCVGSSRFKSLIALLLLQANVPFNSFVFYKELYVIFCLDDLFPPLFPDMDRTGSFLYAFLIDLFELYVMIGVNDCCFESSSLSL